MAIKTEILEALVAAGATAEMIVAAVKADAIEAERKAAGRRERAAERQRRHRLLRIESVTERDERVTERDPSLPPEERSPTPPKTQTPISPSPKPPSGSKGVPGESGRGVRLPDDWQPSDTDRAYARQLGATEPEISRQSERFRNFWHGKSGKDATKASWPATWRNWCLTAQERGEFRSGAPPGGRPRDPHAPLFASEKRI